jgi:hypothetical protein
VPQQTRENRTYCQNICRTYSQTIKALNWFALLKEFSGKPRRVHLKHVDDGKDSKTPAVLRWTNEGKVYIDLATDNRYEAKAENHKPAASKLRLSRLLLVIEDGPSWPKRHNAVYFTSADGWNLNTGKNNSWFSWKQGNDELYALRLKITCLNPAQQF